MAPNRTFRHDGDDLLRQARPAALDACMRVVERNSEEEGVPVQHCRRRRPALATEVPVLWSAAVSTEVARDAVERVLPAVALVAVLPLLSSCWRWPS